LLNCCEGRFCSGNVPVGQGNGENAIWPKCLWILTVFVKKDYLSSWVFTTMQSIYIQMNLSLSLPPKKSWIRLWAWTSD